LSAPDYPADEAIRLLALKRTALLDSPAEERFDRITRLAALIFNVQTCLISLVDADRQWFKSKVGLDAFQTDRDISFCGHAILHPDIFIVTDATKDDRFSANPLVTEEPRIRFYAGAPVCEPGGQPIGTLCLIDPQPRDLTISEKRVLRELADMVEHEIARLDQETLQQKLSADMTRTASIMATLPDMVFVIDRNFRFSVCNEHPDLLKPQHEILGQKILDVLPNELGHQLMDNVKQAFENGNVIHHNYTFKKLNKSFEARYKKIDENEVLIIIRNTTEQTAAHSAIRRLSEVARQTTNGVVITDIRGFVVWINEAFTSITGYSIEDMLGKKPSELLQGADTDPEIVDEMREALSLQQSFNVDVLNYSKEQKPYWARIACNPLLNEEGELSGFIAIQTDITKEKRDEELIRNSENLLKAVIDANTIGTWRLNLQNGELVINDKWASLLGYEFSELLPTTRETWERLTHPDDLAYCAEQIEKHAAGLIPIYEANIRMKHKNGEWIWINTRGRVSARTNDGNAEWMLGTHFDINDQIQAESSLNEKSKQMEAVVESLLDGIITIDSKGKVLTFNQAANEIFGYSDEEIIGRNISMLMGSPHREHHDIYLSNYINRGISDITGRIRELDALHKNGTTFPIELGVVEVKMAGETNFIGIVRDITQRKKREQEIHQLAFYDPLTLLPNRRLLLDRLQGAMTHCSRANNFAALMFLDLDNFKNLNDSAGHNKGDLLLCQVAERLVSSVRQGDTVSRLGGDEFVVVVSDLSNDKETAANQAESLAQKIMAHLAQEYDLEGLTYNSSASIGVTMFNSTSVPTEDLLKQADMAMYKAKETGRNAVQFFDPKMQVAVSSRATLIHDLYNAIQQRQFTLFYQKQIDQHGQVIGVEALLRWFHPEKGMISPAQFIPLTEETGLIVPIGDWILQQACEALVDWASKPAMKNLSVAVNISVVQFSKDDFVQKAINSLKNSGANPQLLKLEITESLLANNIPDVKAKMRELQQCGVTFSIDDFGTGYSSLSYLKQLPINQLKIDQSFVRDIMNSSNDKAIAQAIITLASSMDLQVIAEGVETEDQRALLKSMGCNTYQGYLFGKPCRLEELKL
jgi:diguanylate cyclase (GGDEF)-like protein/PAS domain S-box-containing protein